MSVSTAQNLELYTDMYLACPHQYYPESSPFVNITANPSVYNEIRANQSHMYYFETSDFTSQRIYGSDRSLIVRLEPCSGVVYLFVRRTRPCWPNPWSCVGSASDECEWTHYRSNINGTSDGQSTILEVPLTSTKWFITVFGQTNAKYSLSVVKDPGIFPRFTDGGIIRSRQVNSDTIELSWLPILYRSAPVRGSTYTVYSSMYFDLGALVSPMYIMDTVCGLKLNTDHPYSTVNCLEMGVCRINITGLVNQRKYIFNVVVNGLVELAYAGTLVECAFDNPASVGMVRQTLESLGMVMGSVMAVLIGTYVWLYSRFRQQTR